MNIKQINSKKLFKEYVINIPYAEIEKLIDNKINEIIPTVTISGFRQGKAPFNIVKKKYENNVLSEIIEKIVQSKTKELLDEKKLKPFRQPKVNILKYNKNEPLELNVKIDIKPEFEIAPFKKINVTKFKISIDEKIFEKNYNEYTKSLITYSTLKNERAVKSGDKIYIDFDSKDKSLPDFLQNKKNFPIITNSDYQILPDLSKKIINNKMKLNDEKIIKFDLSEALKDKNKKEVEFSIKLISIEESADFKITKEFLEKNNCKSEKEFKTKINKDLEFQYENQLKEIEKKQLMDILEKNNNFDIPEGIFDEEFGLIWKQVQDAKKNNQLDKDDLKLNEKKLENRYQEIARRRVKLAIIMQKIAEEYSIQVSEKDLTDGLINYASQYPGQEKQIFEYFKNNPSQIERIRGPIFEKKIMDHIMTKTNKKEKNISIDDFKKLQEETFSFNKEK